MLCRIRFRAILMKILRTLCGRRGGDSIEVYLLSACVTLQINAIPDFRTIWFLCWCFRAHRVSKSLRDSHIGTKWFRRFACLAPANGNRVQSVAIAVPLFIRFWLHLWCGITLPIFAKMTRIPPTTAPFDNKFFFLPRCSFSTEWANNLLSEASIIAAHGHHSVLEIHFWIDLFWVVHVRASFFAGMEFKCVCVEWKCARREFA